MSGTLTYIASLSIGTLCPLVVSSIGPAFVDLNAQLTGAIALQASLNATPPTLAADIAALTQVVAELQTAVGAGVPNVSFNLTSVGTLIANIQAVITNLATLNGLFSAGGIFSWTYAGDGPTLGSSLSTALATHWPDGSLSSVAGNGIVLMTLSPSTWVSMQSYFGGI